MKKIIIMLFVALLCNVETHSACKLTGKDVIEKQESKQKVTYEHEEEEMILLDVKSGVKEKRVLKQYIDSSVKKQTKLLLTFMEPSAIKGSALLSWQQEDRENDQWLYLPDLRKVTRVASGNKKKYFMGTDFTYIDLDGEKMADYNYNCLKEEKCEDKNCFVIEALPKDKSVIDRTGYSKRVLWVIDDMFVTGKVDFYDEKGELLKTLNSTDWEKSGTAYRPKRLVMDRGGKHKTFIRITKREINKKIDEIVFTERYLLNGMHMK